MQNLVFVRFFPKPQHVARVRELLEWMVVNTRAEPGCLVYNLYEGADPEKAIFCLVERYRDDDALQAHRETDHYKAYRSEIMELLESPIEVNILKVIQEA